MESCGDQRLEHVRLCLKQFSAAHSVHSLPRLQPNSGLPEFGHSITWPKSETSDFGWRDREGACNKIEGRCKNIHVHTLTPSPTLPRKRGREQTEFAACADSTSDQHALPAVHLGPDIQDGKSIESRAKAVSGHLRVLTKPAVASSANRDARCRDWRAHRAPH